MCFKLPYLFQRLTSLFFDFHFVLAQLTVEPVRHFEPSKHAAFVGVLCGAFAATHPNKFFHVPISMANATNVFFLKGRIEKKLMYRRKYISAAKNLKIQALLKVMLHETIRNDDFQRNTALQHCCNVVSNGYNIVPTLQRSVALQIFVANRPV